MELTVKGKPLKGKETYHISNSVRVNVFDWMDDYYHVEMQMFDGYIWKRHGETRCIDKAEYEQLKRRCE